MTITSTGGPEVIQPSDVAQPSAGSSEVVVEVAAAGLNFIDTYQRSGLYPVELPYTLGLEGAGTVVEVGVEVAELAVGDVVAWCGNPGSYAEFVALPAERAVPVPDGMKPQTAAAVMLQGMTAHYLVTDTYSLGEGDRCLIHAGAGGVGLLLIQMAKNLGAEVFATVGTPEKVALASEAGADHVINYSKVDFGDPIEAAIGERALDVIYDGVGQATFRRGLELLRPRGTMATFGNASGPVEPISPLELAPSLFLTRPSLFHYIADHSELLRRANDLFSWILAGELNVRIGERLPLEEAARSHAMLESRATTGKVLLIP